MEQQMSEKLASVEAARAALAAATSEAQVRHDFSFLSGILIDTT